MPKIRFYPKKENRKGSEGYLNILDVLKCGTNKEPDNTNNRWIKTIIYMNKFPRGNHHPYYGVCPDPRNEVNVKTADLSYKAGEYKYRANWWVPLNKLRIQEK